MDCVRFNPTMLHEKNHTCKRGGCHPISASAAFDYNINVFDLYYTKSSV